MAKFGPEETLMGKLASILKSSNTNQNWLKLCRPIHPGDTQDSISGYFDEAEHNCFVIHRSGQPEERIYNIIDVAANDKYLVDSRTKKYTSWQDYFEVNPIPKQFSWAYECDWPQFGFGS
jgi:hypothetical protein